MGVSFYSCENCTTTCVCGSCWSCGECDAKLCEKCESELVGYDEETETDICPYCTLESASDYTLLEFALTKLAMTREELLELMRKEEGDGEKIIIDA